jgi:DNA-binding PucR family transcriptional regulator
MAAAGSVQGVSLARLVDDLKAIGLRLVHPARRDPLVQTVEIFDPTDRVAHGPSCLMLGVGIQPTIDAVHGLLEEIPTPGVAGVIVKGSVDIDQETCDLLDERGVALVELSRGASWSQVANVVRERLSSGALPVTGLHDGEGPPDDLFDLANAISALVNAPITIEDRDSRVVAFSRHQENTDSARVSTVLGQAVPGEYLALLQDQDVFNRLRKERDPIYLELGGGLLPRLAVALRSGDEFMGSMWAAVSGPVTEGTSFAFGHAADTVALAVLRRRASAHTGRVLQAELVESLLSGTPGAFEAQARLGLAGVRVCVMAAQAIEDREPYREATARRVADALALHLAAHHPSSAAALLAGVAYGVVPLSGDDADVTTALTIARNFAARVGQRVPLVFGVGRVAESVATVATSRRDADRVLRVLRDKGRLGVVASYDEVHLDTLLLHLRDFVHQEALEEPVGLVGELVRHDEANSTQLLDTLDAYLEASGDVGVAAARLHVHPNTFRYRIRRLAEVSTFDPADADARLLAWLQIRMAART